MSTHSSPQSYCGFGVAQAEITPPVGIYHRMWGAAAHDLAEGVHRPLLASVLLFEPRAEQRDAPQAPGRKLVIALDLCVLGVEEMATIRAKVAQETGVQAGVSVVCSHTHGAGLMLYHRADMPGGELIRPYIDRVAATVADLVQVALDGAQPAFITYATTTCDMARQRDYVPLTASVSQTPSAPGSAPAGGAGAYVIGFNPEGIADATLLVAEAVSEAGELLATVINYACHPTTLAWDNRLLSPDFVGAMRETVRMQYDVPCVFLQGASGDVGPRDGFVGDPAVADRNGRWLGYAALSALESCTPPGAELSYAGPVESGTTIGVWESTSLGDRQREQLGSYALKEWVVPLAYRSELPSLQQAVAGRERWQRRLDVAATEVEVAEARAMLERQTRLVTRIETLHEGSFPLQVTAWAIGDALWVTVQGEPYQWLQLELRRRLASRPVIVAAVAEGWEASYLPTRDQYGLGTYEVAVAVLAPGALESLVDSVAEQLAALGA